MKKFLAISFALILLISNTGLTMATHYCGGQAVKSEWMLGTGHLGCGMPAMERHDQPHNALQYEANGCCENDYQTIEVDDDYNSGIQLKLKTDFFIVFIYTYLNIVASTELEKPQYANYSPPLLLRDIPVLNQVFLI